ncbi:TPA: Vitamin K epoxide reductase [Candidatus Saccharibacteria bacterium]|nr:Vitamin K epoxide reductase [Candidatus Saccharibacteria bacterium]
MAKTKQNNLSLSTILPWLFIILGSIALIASILLSVEVFNRLKNPGYMPPCNLSPILSCTDVADSPQSHIFGFPNYFLGIAAYGAVITIGVAMLAGAKFKRWFWQAVQASMTFAFGFITWLQFQSLYRIGALCLFCTIVWATTGPLFWYTTLYNLREGHIKTPPRLKSAAAFAQRHHSEILVVWFLIIIGLILKRFWYYWSSLL